MQMRGRAGAELEGLVRSKDSAGWYRHSPERIKTDGEGRFRIEALVPGYGYRLSDANGDVPFGDALRLGRTKDLGDVQIKSAAEE
jgi:hypothetical protein